MRKPLLMISMLSLTACSKTPLGKLLGKDSVAAPADPATDGKLSESYVAKNGLITVHYPSSFAAKAP